MSSPITSHTHTHTHTHTLSREANAFQSPVFGTVLEINMASNKNENKAASADDQSQLLRQDFEAMAARVQANPDKFKSPPEMRKFYNRFCKLASQLDAELGTKEFLKLYKDSIKSVRLAVRKRASKTSLLSKLTTPIRMLAWVVVVFFSSFQVIALAPIILPLKHIFRLVGLEKWSPTNFVSYALTRSTTAAFGVYVHFEPVPASASKLTQSGAVMT